MTDDVDRELWDMLAKVDPDKSSPLCEAHQGIVELRDDLPDLPDLDIDYLLRLFGSQKTHLGNGSRSFANPPQHVGFDCAGRPTSWGPPPDKTTYTIFIDGKLVQQGTVDPDGTVTLRDAPSRLPQWDDHVHFEHPGPPAGRLARALRWLRHKLWFRASL